MHVVDAFDLPEWLGSEHVTWSATATLTDTATVQGALRAASGESMQQLDLIAVDAAYPLVVCPEHERQLAHQAWQFGQVLLVENDGRLYCAAPGTTFDPDLACEAIRRVAKAVGAPTGNFAISLAL